jgi:DNA (cytosine-5)-methyltransferase 1
VTRPVQKRDTSAVMRKVRSKDTAIEVRFRKAMWAAGGRYRLYVATLPGKPDLVFQGRRVAVFLDGDYWHGNQWRERGLRALEDQFTNSSPAARDYWLSKIRRNVARDCRNTAALLSQGWTVIRFWESDISEHLDRRVEEVMEAVQVPPTYHPFALLAEKTVAEFFAGIGLMRAGLERGGWRIAFANDIDAQKREMYAAHFRDVDETFVERDIHHVRADEVPSVALATASFPCNDLSLAGARRGLAGKHSSTFWGFIQILKDMKERRPPLVLLENVSGFLTSHGGTDFQAAMSALNDLGYAVDPIMLDAAWFVPQSRQRLFIVGKLTRTKELREVPQARMFYESKVRPRSIANFVLTHPEIDWDIRPLPEPAESIAKLPSVLEDYEDNSSEWWVPERAEYLLNQMSSKHRAIAEAMIEREQSSYGTVFRRVRHGKSMAELRTDGIAGCLRTPRGGSGRQILFKAGGGKYFARLLSPRECARLMGADDYHITVPRNQALFGFGDAVVVPAISWIAEYYLNPLVNELLRGRALTTREVTA